MNRDELHDKNKDELQDMARDRDLAVSGTKDELVDRLLDADRADGRADDRSGTGSGDSSGNVDQAPPDAPSLTEVVATVREQLAVLTGWPVENIVGIQGFNDGWIVRAQVIEARHTPPSADLLSVFDVDVDIDQNLTSYTRVQRGTRKQLAP